MIKASAEAFRAASEMGGLDRRAGLPNQTRWEPMANNSKILFRDFDLEDDALDQY
jgi:hypothetical protein